MRPSIQRRKRQIRKLIDIYALMVCWFVFIGFVHSLSAGFSFTFVYFSCFMVPLFLLGYANVDGPKRSRLARLLRAKEMRPSPSVRPVLAFGYAGVLLISVGMALSFIGMFDILDVETILIYYMLAMTVFLAASTPVFFWLMIRNSKKGRGDRQGRGAHLEGWP